MNGPIINGDKYQLIVLKVVGRDDMGRPAKFEAGYDDTTFKLEGGEEFITAFVKVDVVKPKTPTQ